MKDSPGGNLIRVCAPLLFFLVGRAAATNTYFGMLSCAARWNIGCEMPIVCRSAPSRKSQMRMCPSSEPVISWNWLCGFTIAAVTASDGSELPDALARGGGGVSVETTSPVATEWIFTEGPAPEKK